MAEVKPHRIADIIGLVGVIGSLIFVGLEIRQSAVATQAATDAAVADGFREMNLVMASSPELTRWAWQSERFLYNPDFQRFVDTARGPGVQAEARD